MSTAPLGKVAPSSFSVLLRRSKFASYDPSIGQIYTTHGGHAARGDWGLKRPLAIRRRDAKLAIHKIDTLYQQTEWTSAYTDAAWIHKFEEMGVTPAVDPNGTWALRLSSTNPAAHTPSDSDYASNPEDEVIKEGITDEGKAGSNEFLVDPKHLPSVPIPNIRVMNDKRFERYIRKVRRLRTEFEPFLEAEDSQKPEKSRNNGVSSLGTVSRAKRHLEPLSARAKDKYSVSHRNFIASKFLQRYEEKGSTFIRQQPHQSAGLTYTKTTGLQQVLTSKVLPGRRLHVIPDEKSFGNISVNVAVAGWVGTEDLKVTKNQPAVVTTDFGTHEGDPRERVRDGVGLFRSIESKIKSAPVVVGRYPDRISRANLDFRFMNWDKAVNEGQNPHRPGSREYVAYIPRQHGAVGSPVPYHPNAQGMTRAVLRERKPIVLEQKSQKPSADHGSALLSQLRVMVAPQDHSNEEP